MDKLLKELKSTREQGGVLWSLEEKMVEAILSGIGDAVCIFDRNFNILFQSPLHTKWFDKLEEYICFKRVDKPKPSRTIKIIHKVLAIINRELSNLV